MNKLEKAVLVYQAGIANVFQVDRFDMAPEGRIAKRLLQHAFTPCEWYCRGLVAAGVKVTSVHCNRAGDVLNQVWDADLDNAPFQSSMNPVFSA